MISRRTRIYALLFSALLAVTLLYAQPTAAFAQEPTVPTEVDTEVDSVPGLTPFSDIATLSSGEEGGCMVTSASALFCWGNGNNGQNGDGVAVLRSLPVAVSSLSNVTQVSRGGVHSCARTANGKAFCWGRNNTGQIGDSSSTDRPLPTEAIASGVTSVATGGSFSCALKSNGEVFCWGDNTYGQLGNGVTGGYSTIPLQATGIANATAIDAGVFHACARLADGKVKCWGNSSHGQVGHGAFVIAVNTPADVSLPEGVAQITAGGSTTCALTAAGKVYCWGDNASGQLGTFDNPTDHNTPIAPQSLETNIAQIDTNSSTTCALNTSGLVYCWGSSIAGMLGAGGGSGGPAKIAIVGLPGAVKQVSVGTFHVCGLLTDGRVLCWGSNQGNALGDGTNLDSVNPTFVRRSSTCFALTLAATGNGAPPQVSPDNTNGCPLHHYAVGTPLTLTAIPQAQHRVNGWSAPVAFQAGGTLAMLSMPNADTTATVTYAACRLLTRTHTGNGGNPTPSFNNSAGCAAGRYAPGEVIQMAATPSLNQRVQAWSGTAIAPGLGLPVNSVVMPDADRTVNVVYETCNVLTVSASGEGEVPGVFPAASTGCPAGTFVAGETVQFTAAPAQGWRVRAWSGTANDASTATTNTLSMPAANRTVTVVYEQGEFRALLPLVSQ